MKSGSYRNNRGLLASGGAVHHLDTEELQQLREISISRTQYPFEKKCTENACIYYFLSNILRSSVHHINLEHLDICGKFDLFFFFWKSMMTGGGML